MTEVDRTRYALTEAENERIFRTRIVPAEFLGAVRHGDPIAVFLGAQTGAGKTAVGELVTAAFASRGGAVRIDLDVYKPFHPQYLDLVTEDPQTAPTYTSIDGRKWMAKAHDYAMANGLDVVMDSAMRGPTEFQEPARMYQAAGYRVEVAVLAVHEAASRLGMADRYWRQVDETGTGRFVSSLIHDECYAGVLVACTDIDREHLADAVFAVRRTGEAVYANHLVDGDWARPARTAQAVADERARPWTPGEAAAFERDLRRLAGRNGLPPEWSQELARIADLARAVLPRSAQDELAAAGEAAAVAALGFSGSPSQRLTEGLESGDRPERQTRDPTRHRPLQGPDPGLER